MARQIKTPSPKYRHFSDPKEGVASAYFGSLLKGYIYSLGVLIGLGILALGVYFLFEVFGKSR